MSGLKQRQDRNTQVATEGTAEEYAVSALSSAKYMHFPLSSGFLPEAPALKRWNVSPAIILRGRFSDSSELGLSPYAPQDRLAPES